MDGNATLFGVPIFDYELITRRIGKEYETELDQAPIKRGTECTGIRGTACNGRASDCVARVFKVGPAV